jgi:GT2 family glycosyltransferase
VGYAGGINRGLAVAEPAPVVVVLNPDVVLHRSCLAILFRTISLQKSGIVVPKILDADGSLHFSLRREPSLLRALGLNRTGIPALSEYISDRSTYEVKTSVDWALGAAMAISRECLKAVGPWDESYFLYSEETDYCLRARDLGWTTWYEPSAVAVHIGGQSGQSDTTHAMQIVNRVRLYRRRHNALAAWMYFALTTLSELTWIARGHQQSRASVRALIKPRTRPMELRCSYRLMPD